VSPTLSGHLRVVRGEPTPEELAALTAVVTAGAPAESAPTEPPTRGRWNDPTHAHRRYRPVGPAGWRAAVH
jgi:Acyl-CoA carboxylase epsilon subunit